MTGAVATTRSGSATSLPSRTGAASSSRRRAGRIALGLAAAALVLLSWRLPIWQARLSAPQYPQGLSLTATGFEVTGDIAEINELNHYVGMKAFDSADAPEMRLWTPTIALALVGVGLSQALPRRHPLGRLARLGLWAIPVGALLDVQFRLYQYGHSVQPDAAIRLEPFTPLVVGPTKVLNFTTWAYPGEALWLLAGAAFLLGFWSHAGRAVRWAVAAWKRWGVDEDDVEVEAA